MPHGRSWKVLKPNLFESMVMPLFFEYSNYHSFNRLVNAWSFRRISSGPDRGSYYHELFLRGKPHLQKYMRRLPKTHKKLPMKKEDEPDFYKMDKENHLPPLEEQPLLTHKMSASGMHGGMASGMGMQGGMPITNGMHQGGMHMSNGMQMQGMNGFRGQQQLSISPVPTSQGMQRSHGGGYPRMYPEGVASNEQYESPRDGRMGLGGHHQSRSPAFGNSVPGMREPSNYKPMEFKPPSMEMQGGPSNSQQPSQFHNLQRLRQFQQMQMFDGPMGPMNGSQMNGPQMNGPSPMRGGPMNGMNAGPMGGGMNSFGMNGGPIGDDPFARMTYRQQC